MINLLELAIALVSGAALVGMIGMTLHLSWKLISERLGDKARARRFWLNAKKVSSR